MSAFLASHHHPMLIGGQWFEGSGSPIESINPATEESLGTFPHATDQEVADAVDSARRGAEIWRRFSWEQRAEVLRELTTRVESHAEELAMLDALDSGNPIKGMRGDVAAATGRLLYFAGLASESKGTTFNSGDESFHYSLSEPYGVVARIVPFNHPLQFAAGGIAAPLAAGNAIIIKPAEQTSLSALRFAEMTLDVLPPGVVNIVTGAGDTTGSALVRHPGVPRIAFTGSVRSGQAVLRDAAANIKRVTLELGGKNPMIVFPDVDVRAAAEGAVKGMALSRSQGQSCGSNSRILVHERIHDEFVDALVAEVKELRVGDPTDDATDMGPLAFKEHYERVVNYIRVGVEEGAQVIHGGADSPVSGPGYYVEPTVFIGVQDSMRIAREEIFGPVMSVMSWTDYDTMVERANSVEYGLAANIWTNDLTLAHKTVRDIEAGYIWINGHGQRPRGVPFGGYKLSGLGQESGIGELHSYTREKSVVARLLPPGVVP